MQDALAVGVPDTPAHGEGDLVGSDQWQAFAERGQPVELLLQVRPVHHLHLEPRDGLPVEEAVRVNEVRCRQHLDGTHLMTDSLQQLGVEVDEDLEGDVLAKIQ